MFCMKCGKEISDDVAFCPYCGASTKGETPHPERKEKEVAKEYALASLVLGILSLLIPFLDLPFAIIAIVLSNKGKGTTYAETGKVTGIIGLILSIIFYLCFILVIALKILGIINSGHGPNPGPDLVPGISASTVVSIIVNH